MLTNPNGSEDIRRLFHQQVPELANGVVEIKAIAREHGHRNMLAVHSKDPSIDPVGSCVGERGIRIKAVVHQLSGEHIDVIRWSESIDEFIRNALAPVAVRRIAFDAATHRATVTFDPKGSWASEIDPVRLRLASKVVGWDLHLVET